MSGAVAIACLIPGTGMASETEMRTPPAHNRCLEEIPAAAAAYGVPPVLLRAIARTESGRAVGGPVPEPWLYAVNAAGKSHYAENKVQAAAFVRGNIGRGVTSVDVGCMQINLKWHPGAFSSIEEGFDAGKNVRAAARFLAALYSRHGSWPEAVAHYHSGTVSHQRRYLCRVYRMLRLEEGMGNIPPQGCGWQSSPPGKNQAEEMISFRAPDFVSPPDAAGAGRKSEETARTRAQARRTASVPVILIRNPEMTGGIK